MTTRENETLKRTSSIMSSVAGIFVTRTEHTNFTVSEVQCRVTSPKNSFKSIPLTQGFPTWSTCTPRGTYAHLKGYI